MKTSVKRLLDLFDDFFKWVSKVEKFNKKLASFEDESAEYLEKVQVLVDEYYDISSKTLDNSPKSKQKNSAFNKYVLASSKFTNNMTAYYHRKIEYEHLSSKYFKEIVSYEKGFTLDEVANMNPKQFESLIKKFVSIQNKYLPKINNCLIFFKTNLASLRQEHDSLKSDYSKFVQ